MSTRQRLAGGLRLRSMASARAWAIVVTITAGAALASVQPVYQFATSDLCGSCHPDHARQFEGSMHALSHTEPIYNYYFIRASRDTKQAIETFCARCHTPLGLMDGLIPFRTPPMSPRDTKMDDLHASGVQCDFCHSIDGYTELRNAGLTIDRSDTKRGPYADGEPRVHGVAYSELHTSSDLCGICHSVDHPANGIHLQATYDEWRDGPYSREGVRCQDCHMNPNLGDLPRKLPGIAAIGGPNRESVSDHTFVGPSLAFSQGEEQRRRRELSERLLRKAAAVTVRSLSVANGTMTLSVAVTNRGAGHSIPTGLTELREMWLEATVVDSAGREVLHSGGLGKDGNLVPGTVVYTTVVRDAKGTTTTKFWLADAVVSDHRIRPRATVTETLSGPYTGDAGQSFRVRVTLYYRSVAPRSLAEVGMPDGTVQVPVFAMATAEATLKPQ